MVRSAYLAPLTTIAMKQLDRRHPDETAIATLLVD